MKISQVFLTAICLSAAKADRWYVNWLDLECVSHNQTPMTFWSVAYKSKKVKTKFKMVRVHVYDNNVSSTHSCIFFQECCSKVFWWKEDCEATSMPSPSPSQLRGSSSRPTCGNNNGLVIGDGVFDDESTGDSIDESSGGLFGDNASSEYTQAELFVLAANEDEDENGQGQGGKNTAGSSNSNGGNNKQSIYLVAIADTYLRIDRPQKNYGNKKHLIVGTDGETITLIKFDLKRVKKMKQMNCIDRATLSLYSLSKSVTGGVITTYDPIFFSNDGYWDETSITYSNAPKERPYVYYNKIGRVREGKWVDVDVTNELGTDRFITFRIVGGNWNKYASLESRHPPILSIDLC